MARRARATLASSDGAEAAPNVVHFHRWVMGAWGFHLEHTCMQSSSSSACGSVAGAGAGAEVLVGRSSDAAAPSLCGPRSTRAAARGGMRARLSPIHLRCSDGLLPTAPPCRSPAQQSLDDAVPPYFPRSTPSAHNRSTILEP